MSFIPPNEKIIEKKICRISGQEFFVTDKDLEFYEKISPVFADKRYLIPSPTLCPEERQRRRLAFRNERKLYHRKCDKTGNQIISIYSPDKPYTVYDQKVWWGDDWNPFDYGMDFDFNKGFFEQFYYLDKRVPKLNVIGSNNENCSFTHLTANNKDCYLIFESSNNEDCYFGLWLQKSKNCVDCDFMHECELCYYSSDCYKCYGLSYSRNCHNCRISSFLNNCMNCEMCFGCTNLCNKKYYIFNKEVRQEDYNLLLQNIQKEGEENSQYINEKIAKLREKDFSLYANIQNSENCIGDYIKDSKNCFFVEHAHDAEYCKYGEHVWRNAKNLMDVSTVGRNASWIYESINTGIDVNNDMFCIQNWTCSFVLYSAYCFNIKESFGCNGLKRGQNIILNKPYSRNEYERTVGKIINHMKSMGEWGEFFPLQLSPFCYNESSAQNSFFISKEESIKNGWSWKDEEETSSYHGPYYTPLPVAEYNEKNIGYEKAQKNIDDILKGIIKCEITGKPFKIIRQELAFYIEQNIQLPKRHPDQRHSERLGQRNPRTLYERTCSDCGTKIITTYSPERKEKIVCEDCYRKLVY